MESDTEIVRCVVTGETAKAYQLRDADDPSRESYFPKSQVSFQRRNIKTGAAEAVIPMWLLESKGWNS